MERRALTSFNDKLIEEFRQHKGKLGGMGEGWKLILLTTTGAKSGERRTNPLGYLELDGKTVVVASNMGAPQHPGWYHNIRHDQRVTIETGTETYEAIAAIPPGAERDATSGCAGSSRHCAPESTTSSPAARIRSGWRKACGRTVFRSARR
jgi:deazaflavin-dependent oxidoreductase (nitroreductase family)